MDLHKYCPVCNFEIGESHNYCANCGEAITALAKQHDDLLFHNAGLLKIAELSKTTNSLETKNAIKKFLENNK